MSTSVSYSEKYYDDLYEYRLVTIPNRLRNLIIPGKLLLEKEVEILGVKQSPGWEHFEIFSKEPHILIFRRPLN